MLPKVVVYDSVSIDGSIKDFDVDLELHNKVAKAELALTQGLFL